MKSKAKMRTLFGTILAAVVAFQTVAGIDCADVSVADFPRLAGESGDSARIMRAVEAAGGAGHDQSVSPSAISIRAWRMERTWISSSTGSYTMR